jgi:glycine hydroxymethyltransferase
MDQITDFIDAPYTVLVGADHGGFERKNHLIGHLQAAGKAVEDAGPFAHDPADDYPDFAHAVASRVAAGEAVCGVLICRTGIGMSIMANRYPGVRAALANTPDKAAICRQHNCANILVTGGDGVTDDAVFDIVDTWLATPYTHEERHNRRLAKINATGDNETAAVRHVDPDIAACLDAECARQRLSIELIASENFTSSAVRQAQGSLLTNKYAEGYPGRRYYDGCEVVDDIECIAIDRARALFGAEAANVQPHSGSQANMAVYFALLNPGDRVLAMDLAHGGHLTHGLKVNFSGRLFDFIGYGVDADSEVLDYDQIATLAREHRPRMLLAGASAYPRIIDFERLRTIADSVDALLVVDMAHIAGLVAAGLHPNPVEWADVVTTTTHKTLRGPRGGLILARQEYIRKINSQIFPGIQGGPLVHVIAGKAVCLKEAATDAFAAYQRQVLANITCLAAELTARGFRIVSGGTDNHLILVDLRPKGTTGAAAATALDQAGITVNKNLIPFDPEKPMVTSGLRIGSPAVTTRGLKEPEMRQIAGWIAEIVDHIDDSSVPARIRQDVEALMTQYPLP